MNILIIGSGSIGTRHLNNTMTLFPHANVTVVSRSKTALDIHVHVVSSITKAFENLPFYDAAIIATPTSLHVENALELIKNGITKLYIEKPISHTFDDMDELISIAEQNNVQVFVGFDMRFDPGLNKVKELLSNQTIGTLVSVQAEVGQYLPDWRPGTNYKDGMSAKVSLGGGVMLDLIHEFDYLSWLVGSYKRIVGFNKPIDSLDIETEGISVNLFESESGVLGTLSLDYIQKSLNRRAKFIGDFGTIEWNYVTSEVKWKTQREPDWDYFHYSDFNRNDRFVHILNAFYLATPSEFDARLTSLPQSLISLKAVLDAKASANLKSNN
jgi:predicted dehydrogenase